MNAPSERDYLRLVESPLTPQETAERPALADLNTETFGPPCPIYPLAILRKVYRRG